MIIENKELDLCEIIKETQINFKYAAGAMNSLVKLRIVKTQITSSNLPKFNLINEIEARKYYYNLKHQPENSSLNLFP